LIVLALGLAAVSLLFPSTPSYDPWAWIIWGREIVHLKLHTVGGPTWKPLPVIFTTLFAPFGQAEPDLWLVIARAGAIAAVGMVFRVAFRMTRDIGAYLTRPAGELDQISLIGPALLAGGLAALSLTLSGGFLSDSSLGYSEGLATAAILIAIERGLDGHFRQALAVGFIAALDRPEIWVFWGPFGLWLFWKDPAARKLVLGLFILIPVLWFAPEYWGSGHFLRGVSRAQHPRSTSLAFAQCPFCAELVHAAWPTMLLRLKFAAAVLIAGAAWLFWSAWRVPVESRTRVGPRHGVYAAAGLGVLGAVWFVLIALMTQIGFSGNDRYLVIGSAMVDICGAVGWAWAATEIGGLLSRLVRGAGPRVRNPLGAWAAAALAGLVFLYLPNWLGRNYIDLARTHAALVYEAHQRQDAAAAVARAGGSAKLLRCGSVMTEEVQVPLVAWVLGVHTVRVSPQPTGTPGPPPNVILQTASHVNTQRVPSVKQWPNTKYTKVAHVRSFRVFEHCA
jgi:hypothetical protein